MPAMEQKGAAQSAGSGGQGKPGGSGEEWSGGKSGATGGAGAGGIASINPQFAAALGGTKGSGAGYAPQVRGAIPFSMGVPAPAAMLGQMGTFPTSGPIRGVPFSMGVPEPLAPVTSQRPPQRPAGLDPEATLAERLELQAQQWNALPPEMRMGGLGNLMTGRAFTTDPTQELSLEELLGAEGRRATIGIGFPTIPGPITDPTEDGELAVARLIAETGAIQSPPSLGLPGQPPSIGTTATAPEPAVATPTQMMTPGRMMPQAGAMQTRASIGQYSPSASPAPVEAALAPATSPRPPMAPVFQTEGFGQTYRDGTNYGGQTGSLAPATSLIPPPRPGAAQPSAEPQSTLGQPPAPQPTMSPSEVAAPAPQGMPATSYPVPSSATVPGLGLMSGIQQGIGAIRELFGGGGQPLFGEGGLFPADTRTSEERIADFVSSQAEMSQGDDRVYPEPTTDDSGSFLPGFGPEPETPTPTTPEPTTPAPPYVYPTGGYPIYGYNSYNDLMAAMGMAGGGQVRAGMGNAFAPGSYYARYNPHMRGLGGLRRG